MVVKAGETERNTQLCACEFKMAAREREERGERERREETIVRTKTIALQLVVAHSVLQKSCIAIVSSKSMLQTIALQQLQLFLWLL